MSKIKMASFFLGHGVYSAKLNLISDGLTREVQGGYRDVYSPTKAG